MKKAYVLALVFSLLLSAQAEEITEVVARVNNQVITSQDLDEYCQVLSFKLGGSREESSCENKEFKKEALTRLIDDKLILDESKRENMDIPRSWIDDRFNRIVSSHPSRDEFEASLKDKGLTITSLKQKIKEQYLIREIIDKYVKSFVSISPSEISRYYAENKDVMQSPAGYIFYIARSEDKSVLEEIAAVITEEGIAKARGAYADTLNRIEANVGELKEEIARILKEAPAEGYALQKIDGDFYLIYLERKIPPRPLSLEEAKEKIHFHLWQMKFQSRFSQWVGELREKAVIEVYYE